MEQGKVFHTEAVGDISNAIQMFRGAAGDVKRMETSVIPLADARHKRAKIVSGGKRASGFPTKLY